MLKTHVCLLNCHSFAWNSDHSPLDSTIIPQWICKLCGHVRALFATSFTSSRSSAIFADVWLSSGLLSSLLSWLPQRRGFPPVVCKLLLYPAPLQQVTAPRNVWLLGLGRHSLHTSPFLLTGVEWENGYAYSELSIHLLVFQTPDWGWVAGEQERDRTPCILPWSTREPMPYGVLSRGYVPIPGKQFWSLKRARWCVASGYVCLEPAREVSQQYFPWEPLSSVSRVGSVLGYVC